MEKAILTQLRSFLKFLWALDFKNILVLGLLFFTAPVFSVSSCRQVEKAAQDLIFVGKDYKAADLIEDCFSVVKKDSTLYQFLGRHYHRRKKFITSVQYYKQYFEYHDGTFTERMIFVHSLFSLFVLQNSEQYLQEIESFMKNNFPTPAKLFSCKKYFGFDDTYLCYMRSFRKNGIRRETFENFLNTLLLKNNVKKLDIIFWHEIYVALFPDKRSWQMLATRLYNLNELKKSLKVYGYLQKNYADASIEYMIGQLRIELGEENNNLIDQE